MIKLIVIVLILFGIVLLALFITLIIRAILGAKHFDLFMAAACNTVFEYKEPIGKCKECGEDVYQEKISLRSWRYRLCPVCFEKLKADRLREFKQLSNNPIRW